MNTCLFIDTNGKIRVNEFPLEPNYGDCHMYAAIDGLNPQVVYSDAMKAHRIAVQAALDNGVVCEDQEEGRKLIEKTYCEANRISPFDFIPTNNFLYPIPDYKMEVKTHNWIHPEKKLASLTLISNV